MLKNRWNYTSIHEKKQFSFTMFLISSTVLLEFILLDTIGRFVFRVFNIITSNGNSIFYKFFSSLEDEEFFSLANNLISTVTLWLSFFISCAVLIIFLRKVMTKADSNINNKVSFRFKLPKNTFFLLLFGLSIVYFCGYISIGFDSFLGIFGIEKILYDNFAFPQTVIGISIYFFSIVITPSILEEIFCRYLILNVLRKYGDGFAITVSSVFFGLMHGSTNAFFFATAIGFFSAYYAIKTKSLWFSIILHAFINFMSFFWHLIGDLSETYNFIELFEFIFQIVLTVLFGIAMIYLFRLIKSGKDLSLKRRRDYIYINPGRKTAVFFNAATIIFIVLAVLQSALKYNIPGVYWQ